MGTASTTKFVKNNAGSLQEQAALTTSAGAGDANAIPALNASGVLDDTIVNSSATTAANKLAKMNASGYLDATILRGITSSAGATDSGKTPQTDSSGRIDLSFMPVGVAAEVATIAASENLAAGDFVNIWNSAGTAKARKADGSTSGKIAHGFILSAVTSGNNATVYLPGSTNTQVTGQTPGTVFLSASTPGAPTATAPSGSGNVVQELGTALSATAIIFYPKIALVLS